MIANEKYHQIKLRRELNLSVQLAMATGFAVELFVLFPPTARKKNDPIALVSKKLLPKV